MHTPPILFLIFNRPSPTGLVFDAIRAARPTQLFVAADGPRGNRNGEAEICEETRSIIQRVDWDCDVKTLFRESNAGCEIAVSDAISWFFQHVNSGIILEDDCLPDSSFFPFCAELLERYSNERCIGSITGDNFQWGRKVDANSYYFSKYSHCWGWATWKRAWDLYDHNISEDDVPDEDVIANFSYVPKEIKYWKNAFNSLRTSSLNTWDYRWKRSLWKQKLLTVTPECNLVTNIGFGGDASHTHQPIRVPKSTCMRFPLRHPRSIIQNAGADARVARNHFGLSLSARIFHRWFRLSNRIASSFRINAQKIASNFNNS